MAYEQAATGAYYGGVETAAAAYPPPWAVALQDSVAGLRNEIVGLRNDIANVRASLNRVESYTVYARNDGLYQSGSNVIIPLPGVNGQLAPAGLGPIETRLQIDTMLGPELTARLMHLGDVVPPAIAAHKKTLLARHHLGL